MTFQIKITVDGQVPWNWDGEVDNLKKNLHEAVQLYLSKYYVKEKEVHLFDKLENHPCKTCQEGTITEFYGQTSDGVKIRCTKCGTEDWL